MKHYAKLDRCLDALEARIGAGDRSGGKFGPWWSRPTWFVTSRMPSGLMLIPIDWDVSPYPHLMRAEAAIDVGDYARALQEASSAFHLTGDP